MERRGLRKSHLRRRAQGERRGLKEPPQRRWSLGRPGLEGALWEGALQRRRALSRRWEALNRLQADTAEKAR